MGVVAPGEKKNSIVNLKAKCLLRLHNITQKGLGLRFNGGSNVIVTNQASRTLYKVSHMAMLNAPDANSLAGNSSVSQYVFVL